MEDEDDVYVSDRSVDAGYPYAGSLPLRTKTALPPDATELELEKLVFGDAEGFRVALGTQAKSFRRSQDVNAPLEDGEVFGAEDIDVSHNKVDDAQLFLVDTEPSNVPDGALLADRRPKEKESRQSPPAWEDSDDERLTVSLASMPRLRKLREFEGEDVVNGTTYIERLRRQFELLHPEPDWAKEARQRVRRPASDSTDLDESVMTSEEENDNDDDEFSGDAEASSSLAQLLRESGTLLQRHSEMKIKRPLRPDVINIDRTNDVCGIGPSSITTLEFHPRLPVLLSTGPSSNLSLYYMSPKAHPDPNPLLTTLHVTRTPLTCAAFDSASPRIFLSSRRRYMHVWDLSRGVVEKLTRVYGHQAEARTMETFKLSPDGSWLAIVASSKKGVGTLHIINAHTLQWAAEASIQNRGGIADFGWWSDSTGISIAGRSGEISEWSINHGRLLYRWVDEGGVAITTLALGGRSKDVPGGDRWVALGSASGIVNVYDRASWSTANLESLELLDEQRSAERYPKPIRMLDQLTTPISHLRFSPDGQVLAMASRWKSNALRLVHLPTAAVYRNWPTTQTALGRVTAIAFADFSPSHRRHQGKNDATDAPLWLAVANETGRIRLWEIRS